MEKDPFSTYYKKILVPFDGSAGSSKALRKALALAKEHGSEVTAFSVDEHVPRYAPGVGKMQEERVLRDAYFVNLHDQAWSVARELGAEIKTETAVGHAAQAILQIAGERGFDVIVIGHTGHSGAWGKLLGSTTSRVVDQAHCDVLVVR